MSFREKSTIATLAATILVYGWYFITYISRALGAETLPAASLITKPLIVTVILVVIINIVSHIVLAIAMRHQEGEIDSDPDERDKLIDLRGDRRGGLVLSFGAVVTIGALILEHEPFWIVNVLLGFFVAAEIVKGASKIVEYRRGF